MNARYKIGERVHLRYRHEILCLDIVNTLSNGVLGEPGYIVRRTDGKKLPFFRAVPESELSPCDCKPAKSFPAALPASPTLRLPNRSTDENPTIPKSNLNNNHRIWLKLQALLKEAEEVLGESEVSALKTRYGYKSNVRYWESNASLAITLEERLAEIKSIIDSAPLKVGDWVRHRIYNYKRPVKIKKVVVHPGSPSPTVRYVLEGDGFNLWYAVYLEKVDGPFVLVGEGTLETARDTLKAPAAAGLLPAPSQSDPIPVTLPPSQACREPLPGKYQRGQWVMTAHGKGRVLGLGAPGLYHVVIGSRRIIAREEYMQAAIPDWTLKSGDPSDYLAEKMAYEHALKTFPGTTPYIRVERDGYGIGYVTFQGGEKFYPMKQAWKTMKAHGVDNPAVRLDVRGQIVQIRPYEEVAYGVATC